MTAASLQRRSPCSGRRTADRPGVGCGCRWLGVAGALLAAVLVTGCGSPLPSRTNKTIEVIATTPITDDVLDYQDFTGRLDATSTVEIRPRASGYVKTSPFKEGDRVREGDVLFQVDSRTYQADLNQAEANLELAIADRALQQLNAERTAP